MTPSQLARKRANDRDAQRAIRARTKEHIERLEQQLADLKGKLVGDSTVQDLIRRNRMLEDEIARLRYSVSGSYGGGVGNAYTRRGESGFWLSIDPVS